MAAVNELNSIATFLEERVKMEFVDQGHNNTGRGVNSIKVEFKESADLITFLGYGEGYLNVVNNGVSPNRVPYSEGSGASRSRFIDALVTWVKQRGIASNNKEALGIAFAIAKTAKKEGIPTKGSLRFSKTGERVGFIDIALDSVANELDERIEEVIGRNILRKIERVA